jgi:rSAM/selenodomain-associated transferase 2
MQTQLSIIIPVLDEAPLLGGLLASLQDLRQRGHEVLVVDGGSRDGSVTIARKLADRVLLSGPGRALQMNAGAESARHEILLFLHADSRLPAEADALIGAALQAPQHVWGSFNLRLDNARPVFRLLEAAINWRTALTGVASGAQAIFVERTYFERVGSYDRLPVLEDAALSRKLLRHARPQRITTPVLASSRRWERDGVLRTLLLKSRLRAASLLGVRPERLAELYPRTGSL